jgi:hypothetical protein
MLRIACFLLLSLSLSTPTLADWSYPKASVLEFFADWRLQIAQDRYLEDRERDLRIELVDRLSFQIDTKYAEQNLHQFFIDISNDIALTEHINSNRGLGSKAELFKNLSLSLQEILEPSENVLSFLRSFVEFTGVKNPKSVDAFADSRSYTNGYEMQAAEKLTLDEAARLAMAEVPEAFVEQSEISPEELAKAKEVLEFDRDLRSEFESEFEPRLLPEVLPPSSDLETLENPPATTPDQSQTSLSPQTANEDPSSQSH